MNAFNEFLLSKGEAYSNIDVERFPRFWSECANRFQTPSIVQIIGTNGKGSTGRILADFCHTKGIRIAHYSSPHILRINERFWLNGAEASDRLLQEAHEKLYVKIGAKWAEKLSYFEYATILAIELFCDCDLAIMEAGLGGEFDATSVFPCELLLITPIDYDHQHILGDTIELIAHTKLKAMRSTTILAKQEHNVVYEIAQKIANERKLTLYKARDLAPSLDRFETKEGARFMAINRQLAFAAAAYLKLNPSAALFKTNPLLGRLTKIAPNVSIDAGHNAHAARAIREAYGAKQVTLVYNSFADKDYKTILHILKPIVKRCLLIGLDHLRAADKGAIVSALDSEEIARGEFSGVIDKNEEYLVFGGFSVVEAFLKARNAR
ncbi:MAG: bifunctional folylpolyglutamate synthase/dihydrofolate synthase [Helicobacteraceae bacterium]|jgi:dihydrofolate synthase/folylpolyglutamate synthase|nr:bifunctional folylpolyglutamate synthase/dihydrofolate synthase [Helicobacteraceae bacterium]